MRKRQKNLNINSEQPHLRLMTFLSNLGQVKNMGPLDELIKMMPGANKMKGIG